MENFWPPIQKIIKDICLNFDQKWQKRQRIVNTHFLVLFIIKLIISKNKQGYKSLLNELWENNEVSTFQKNPIAASSICEARQKMPEEIFIELNKEILLQNMQLLDMKKWNGHRIFACDGTKITLPHELILSEYQAPNKGQYYPQGLASCIYHLGSGIIYDFLLTSSRNERHSLIKQMDVMSKGDVLVLDRGYFSYLLLHQAIEKGLHIICRIQSGTVNKEIQKFLDSNSNDKIITYYPADSVKSEIKKQGFNIKYKEIKLRLIKYRIDSETYVCATTLIGEQYKITEFPKIYHGRWGIEELYKISKEFVIIEDFHAKNERGVKQELYAHVLL